MSENFLSAYMLASDLYGIEIDEEHFETWGLLAWNKIGNKKYVVKRAICHQDKDEIGWYINKPCDADIIESVTLPFEDVVTTSSIVEHPDTYTAPVENWIETEKWNTNMRYQPGKLIKYLDSGDKLYFSDPYPELHVLYKTIITDDELLPYLNEKEKFAIATYIAYCHFYKTGLQTKDSGTLQMAQLLKADWMKACNQAKTPESLSENYINEVLDAQTSYDRHFYGRTNKF